MPVMSTLHLLDPELRASIEAFPALDLSPEMLPVIREFAATAQNLTDAKKANVTREEVYLPGLAAADPDVRCLIYKPMNKPQLTGAYLHMHGGGYILGTPEMSDSQMLIYALHLVF